MKLSSYRHLRVPNFSVRLMRDSLRGLGLDESPCFLEANLDTQIADELGGSIPAEKELAFQSTYARLTDGYRESWLRVGKAYSPALLGVYGLAVSNVPTLGDLIRSTPMIDPLYGLLETRTLSSGGVACGLELVHAEVPENIQMFLRFRDMAASIEVPFALTRGELSPVKIESPGAPEDLSLLRDFHGVQIMHREDSVRIWWSLDQIDVPFPWGNELAFQTYLARAIEQGEKVREAGDWAGKVAQRVRTDPINYGSLVSVARGLSLAPRTLQRHLAASGQSFRQIQDQILHELACDLLRTSDLSVARIAARLGYADPANFTAAFRRWNGKSPSLYRSAGQNRLGS